MEGGEINWRYIYAMLAAEFGYSYKYVDWCLDMDDLSAHMEYKQDNPHPGALIMAILESFNGDKNKKNPKARKKRTPEEQKQFEQEQLQSLVSQFGPLTPKPKRKIVDYVC